MVALFTLVAVAVFAVPHDATAQRNDFLFQPKAGAPQAAPTAEAPAPQAAEPSAGVEAGRGEARGENGVGRARAGLLMGDRRGQEEVVVAPGRSPSAEVAAVNTAGRRDRARPSRGAKRHGDYGERSRPDGHDAGGGYGAAALSPLGRRLRQTGLTV